MTRRRVLPVAVFLLAVATWFARPVRWEVDGLSMAPGLLPGDVVESAWFPLLDRWRRPQRFERWTLAAPDGAVAVKRVWGLPGEEIAIVAGDLTVDGRVVVTPPWALAEVALPVAPVSRSQTDGTVRLLLPDPVLDDVPFAPDERRILEPVCDVGVAAVIDFDGGDQQDALAVVEVSVASRAVSVRLQGPGRHGVVAGRLDGTFVAAAWPLARRYGGRSCLPAGGPDAWAFQSRWARDAMITSLAVRVVAPSTQAGGAMIQDVVAWRDVHHLVPADGTARWRLAEDECFVIGDYPGGSRDSRQWGPVGIDRFRDRLAAPPR